jgi:hypothetical protein
MDIGEKDPLFTKCECSSHILEVRRYDYCDEGDKGFYFTHWNYGRVNHPMGWKERIRWCWRILHTGDPWADSIVVSDENAIKISEYIKTNL